MPSKSLLLIQAGTPPEDIRAVEGDLPDWFCNALSCPQDAIDVVRVFDGQTLPKPGEHKAAVITGSWSMVTDMHPWSELTAQWIRDAMQADMPMFGVCYGHQLMAHALGGEVGYLPDGLEIGCQSVVLAADAMEDPWLRSMPRQFYAHLTHMQTVIGLPKGVAVLASSARDPHQILRYGPNALSSQFHPEFTNDISAACIRRRAELLRETGHDSDALLKSMRDTPHARSLLTSFVRRFSPDILATSTDEVAIL